MQHLTIPTADIPNGTQSALVPPAISIVVCAAKATNVFNDDERATSMVPS